MADGRTVRKIGSVCNRASSCATRMTRFERSTSRRYATIIVVGAGHHDRDARTTSNPRNGSPRTRTRLSGHFREKQKKKINFLKKLKKKIFFFFKNRTIYRHGSRLALHCNRTDTADEKTSPSWVSDARRRKRGERVFVACAGNNKTIIASAAAAVAVANGLRWIRNVVGGGGTDETAKRGIRSGGGGYSETIVSEWDVARSPPAGFGL